jgi:hypothetical protein
MVPIYVKVTDWARTQDGYGKTPQLKYKGEDTFQTLWGGVVTIVSRIGILYFVIYSIMLLFDKEHNISKFYSTTDILADPQNYTIGQAEFEYAAKPHWNYLDETVEKDVGMYVQTIFGAEFIEWVDGIHYWR